MLRNTSGASLSYLFWFLLPVLTGWSLTRGLVWGLGGSAEAVMGSPKGTQLLCSE